MSEQGETDKAVRKFVDSTVAVAFARFLMPIFIAVIGWFMVTTITDLKTEIRDGTTAIWQAVKQVQITVNSQSTDIAVLKQNKDDTSRSLDRLTGIVDKLNLKP